MRRARSARGVADYDCKQVGRGLFDHGRIDPTLVEYRPNHFLSNYHFCYHRYLSKRNQK